jgi:hypothetical protein
MADKFDERTRDAVRFPLARTDDLRLPTPCA